MRQRTENDQLAANEALRCQSMSSVCGINSGVVSSDSSSVLMMF